MKKLFAKFISLMLCVALCSSFPVSVYAASANNTAELNVLTEFENMDYSSNYVFKRDKNASARFGIVPVSGSMNTTVDEQNPDITVKFNSDSDCPVYVWIRYSAGTNGNDSVFMASNSDIMKSEYGVSLPASGEGVFAWRRALSTMAYAGENVFKITAREPGCMLDAFIISTEASFVPESNDDTTQTEATEDAGDEYEILPGEEKVSFTDGIAHAEAEKWRVSGKGNILLKSGDLSGGAGILIKNLSGSESLISDPKSVYKDPLIKITFEVTEESENFVFWIRYNAQRTGADSIYWCVDNNAYTQSALPNTSGSEFRWVSLGVSTLDKGVHTLSTAIREYNIAIDKIVISSNSLYAPSGMGEYEKGKVNQTEIIYHTDMVPKSERPRVMLNKSDVLRILENAAKDENKSAYADYQKFAAMDDDCSSLTNNGEYSRDAMRLIEAKAFSYIAEGNEENGKTAIKALINFITKCPSAIYTDYNSMGHTTYMIGIVYDWCYPLLTQEEKIYLQNQVVVINSQNEIGWPPSKGSAVVSHSSEGMLMRDLVACAIAMYEDREDIYQNVMGRFFGEYVPARKELYGKAGSYFMGNHYLQYRNQWELFAVKLIEKGYGIKHIFGENYGDLMYKLLYSRRGDGGLLREGDSSFNGAPGEYITLNNRLMFYTASIYDNPYLKYYGTQQMTADSEGTYHLGSTSYPNQLITPVEFMIMNNPDIEAKSYKGMPLTRYFPSPYGSMIARTGWDDGVLSDDVVAEMKITEYSFSEHQHLDAGAFQIYYKGALANDTGYYQQANMEKGNMEQPGNTACASVHDRNYQSRTIAHNCMLVYDPSEKHIPKDNLNTTVENDGGQERKHESFNPKTYAEIASDDASWRCGEVLGHEYGMDSINPDWTYLKGDIADAYSDKVSEYERSFMFLNLKDDQVPAVLIVFDRIESSNADFKKTWLLHTMNTPEINGNRTVATVTHSDYNGKLTLDTLLPAEDNTMINVVEGEAGDGWVNGINYYAELKSGMRNEGGSTRVEISPKSPQKLDYFLNVMQVSDADKDYYKELQKIETSTHAGVVVADRVVAFAKQRDRIKDDITLSFTGDEDIYQITVADCMHGIWEIYDGEALIGTACVTKEGGVLPFEAASGTYTLKYRDESVTRQIPDGSEITEVEIASSLMMDRKYVCFENEMFMQNSSNYADAEAVLEFIGYVGDYNKSEGVLKMSDGEEEITLKRDNLIATTANRIIRMKSAAVEKDGVLYVPVRELASLFDYSVSWDPKSRVVSAEKQIKDEYADIVEIESILDGASGEFISLPARASSDENTTVVKFKSDVSVSEIEYKTSEPIGSNAFYSMYVSTDSLTWTPVLENAEVSEDCEKYYEVIRRSLKARYIKFVSYNTALSEIRVVGVVDYNTAESIANCTWSGANGAEIGTNTYDGDYSTLWSNGVIGCWIQYEFDKPYTHTGIDIIWNNGDKRVAYYDILVSDDGENWKTALSGASTSGKNAGFERTEFPEKQTCRFIRIVCNGNSVNDWGAIKEVRFIRD